VSSLSLLFYFPIPPKVKWNDGGPALKGALGHLEVGKDVNEADEGMPIGSRVTRFVVRVIDAILPSLEECPDSVDRTHNPCQLETIGRQTTTKGNNVGRAYAIMNACSVCSKAKAKNGTGGIRGPHHRISL
jgi:hypothetical protein